ncbi:hypothetical protein BFW01_g71 [Lasiodiplodia theobromae]|uniref:Uncharacterized protein n=1 Tax=Lasiodiplodia theobromae TaxID=45133 RepID=A0A5N5DAH3_9PEZI|nr:uncharacterized protein LTHEOB_12943 [Lasiodiplodia theobromae]KAB2574400.1 hypothetical protein DBV05_g6926 [Lasiodiplodia theobromae]KAF4534623.1 hypothetical protein LTHEOB_12943 [Lasiodiplodia theobromae]KAF9629890.1 hypothetical protein BFW01_g71 [Lasiodiplodia theobromae]
MCLVKVHEEPDVVVPYRVASRRRSHYSSYSPPRSARLSRTIVDERRPPSVVSHHFEKTRVSAVDAPPPKAIPPPQPVPVFVKPPSPPPPPPAPPRPASPPLAHHLVEVSPASSRTSISESDYIVREHEVHRHRATEYSPSRSSVTDHSPRYETFRYIEPPDEHRYHQHHNHWSRSSERSASRDRRSRYDDDPRESYRSTRIEVSSSRRPREYWR